MQLFLGLSRAIDRINTVIGRVLAWAILAAVVVSAANAIIRKVFSVSSNAWLELQWILFGVVFLLCAPWTLLSNEHIRIDIVNAMLSKRIRNWIDLAGHVFFLLPLTLVMLYLSWPFFWVSFGQNEQSANAGGLPVYPSKFLIPLAFALLLAQAFSEIIKRIAIMRGDLEETATGGGHHASAEAEAQRVIEAAREEADKRARA